MFTLLTSLGLVIIPFFMWPGCDSRSPKLFIALVFSLILSLYVIYKGWLTSYKNIWFILFLLYIPLNFLLTPKINLMILGLPILTFWLIQAYLIILIFFLGHLAINSVKFSESGKEILMTIMVYVGTIMAIYAILQRIGFDQFWVHTGEGGEIGRIAGTLGNRVILAPFLAILIPLALYLKKYINAIILFFVVLLCNSQVGYGGMIVSLMFLVATKSKKLMIVMISLFTILTLILSIGYFKSPVVKNFIKDNHRFIVWKTIIKDIKLPKEVAKGNFQQHSLTGFGLGSFRYIFHSEHKDISDGRLQAEAHNDYLELLYNTGLIGLTLFIGGLIFIIKSFFPLDILNAHILASLICILICAGGIFCLQNGAIIFYVLTIIGLANRREKNVCKV